MNKKKRKKISKFPRSFKKLQIKKKLIVKYAITKKVKLLHQKFRGEKINLGYYQFAVVKDVDSYFKILDLGENFMKNFILSIIEKNL